MSNDWNPLENGGREAFDFASGVSKALHAIEATKQTKLMEEQIRLQKEALELEKKRQAQEQEKIKLEREQLARQKQVHSPTPIPQPSTAHARSPAVQEMVQRGERNQKRYEQEYMRAQSRIAGEPDETRKLEMVRDFVTQFSHLAEYGFRLFEIMGLLGRADQYNRDSEEVRSLNQTEPDETRKQERVRDFEAKYAEYSCGLPFEEGTRNYLLARY